MRSILTVNANHSFSLIFKDFSRLKVVLEWLNKTDPRFYSLLHSICASMADGNILSPNYPQVCLPTKYVRCLPLKDLFTLLSRLMVQFGRN